jgi:hypothetical protein
MKLLFDSLDALLGELRERKVQVVRVSPSIHLESGARTAGIPHLTSRVVVTAAIDEHLWAEWRHFVGRGLAEVSKRIDDAGFLIREGMLAHDTAAMDTFRL